MDECKVSGEMPRFDMRVEGVCSDNTTGKASVAPVRRIWRKVLYLETVVGWTSADGREKSQYRRKVFGAGNDA